MGKTRNILFIMFDQLRWDYLSCAGHPYLHTPNIDRIAGMGVRFSRAYVQSPICGSSRMSFYTGRYVHSHGAQRNNYPLKVGEHTIGDHLRATGMDAFLVGKTHMEADARGMERLGIAPDTVIGARVAECGFDVVVRDDGLWAEGPDGFYDERRSPYNEYLRAQGYPPENPWSEHANAGVTDDGDIASGWLLENALMPANVREEDSETPWLTRECIDFLRGRAGAERPWMVHLSYIKPHWPYIVPAPYNDIYGGNQVLPAVLSEAERADPHPIYGAYMDTVIARSFSREEVRQKVVPAYMALIKQCDDQIGVLLDYLEASGRLSDTMIVLTSDHGDYLGDHWLGEKNFFHECAVKIPLIVYDPDPAADATRGTVCDELVESLDLAATFVDLTGASVPNHIIEGRSLLPFLHGPEPTEWRDYIISEFDYTATPMMTKLGVAPRDARLFMVADKRWKLIHAEGGFDPLLFDLENDPNEFHDLGRCPDHAGTREMLYARLGAWARRLSQRTTLSDDEVRAMTGKSQRKGVLLGVYDGSEIDADLLSNLRGKARARYV